MGFRTTLITFNRPSRLISGLGILGMLLPSLIIPTPAGAAAPTIDTIASVNINEAQSTTRTVSVHNDAGVTTNISITGAFFISPTSFSGTGDFTQDITISPSFSNSGNYTVNVTGNSGGLTGSTSFAMTVNNVNRSPVVTLPAVASAQIGVELSVNISASDPDFPGPAPTLSGTGYTFTVPNIAHIDILSTGPGLTTGRYRWTPALADVGQRLATICASDGALSSCASISITVAPPPPNRAPVFDLINDITVQLVQDEYNNVVLGYVNFDIRVVDPDGDPIRTPLIKSGTAFDPSRVTIARTSGVPDSLWGGYGIWTQIELIHVGVYPGTICADDVYNLRGCESFTITVLPPPNLNYAPVAQITATPAGVCLGDPITLDGSGSTDEDGTVVGYQWTFNDGYSFSTPLSSLDYFYDQAGSFSPSLAVVDDDGATSNNQAIATVTIGEPMDISSYMTLPPYQNNELYLNPPSNRWYERNVSFQNSHPSSNPLFQDADVALGSLSLSFTDSDGIVHRVQPRSAEFSSQNNDSGYQAFNVTFTEEDIYQMFSSLSDDSTHVYVRLEGRFTQNHVCEFFFANIPVHVIRNHPPVLTIPEQTVRRGNTLSYTLQATDPEQESLYYFVRTYNENFNYAYFYSDYQYNQFSWYGELQLIGLTLGRHEVEFCALDTHYGVGCAIMVINVVNNPPIATASNSPSLVCAGSPVTLDGSASRDPDGTLVSQSWNFGDSTPNSTLLTQSHTYATAGNYSPMLTVTDNDGGTASTSLTLNVQQPQHVYTTAPHSTSFVNYALGKGSVLNLDYNFASAWQNDLSPEPSTNYQIFYNDGLGLPGSIHRLYATKLYFSPKFSYGSVGFDSTGLDPFLNSLFASTDPSGKVKDIQISMLIRLKAPRACDTVRIDYTLSVKKK